MTYNVINLSKKPLVFTTKSFLIIFKTSTYVEKIYHHYQVLVLIIPNFHQNKKASNGTFFTHLISQSAIANIMAVEAIWQIKLTQIRIHIILRLD